MKNIKYLALALALSMMLGACAKPTDEPNPSDVPETTEETAAIDTNTPEEDEKKTVEADFSKDDSDMFTKRDMDSDYNNDKSVQIKLNGDSVNCNSDSVQINGTTAVISNDGTYILSGTLNDGMIIVNADKKDKLQIVLDGVSITSKTSAPIYIQEADKVVVTLADGTENTLSNGGGFTAIDKNNIDGAVFSKDDLTFNGSGSLTVNSPAGHGIVSKDDLVFTGGTYTVNSASHGLQANDSVRIKGTTLNISAGKDGIHAENKDDESLGFVYVSSGTFNISAEGDGLSAGAYMQIMDGEFDIVSGGGSVNAEKQTSDSWGGFMGGRGPGGMGGMGKGPGQGGIPGAPDASDVPDTPGAFNPVQNDTPSDDSSTSIKGIKATGDMLINDGTYAIDSADDAVHSNGSIYIKGGTLDIKTGDDGFHADAKLEVSGGKISIAESYEGLEALELIISGGDIELTASDDGLNAAGGTDSSGFGGQRESDMFKGHGGPGGMGGGNSSNGSIVISGGNIRIKAYGDGIDANGTLEIKGGYIEVCGPTMGDTATLDYDISGTISGGTFIGTGASGMAQTFSSSEQGVIAINVGKQSGGTKITLTDKSGNEIISHTPELDFAVVILSSPEIVTGETYTVTIGSMSDDVQAS